MQKKRIVFAGIGAVGGFYGGMMSRYAESTDDFEVAFFSRGKHLQAMKDQGLKLITTEDSFVVRPALVTDDVMELGTADYLILATKSYDLDQVIQQLKPCISPKTILLPLLNGADITFRIRNLLPGNEVWFGCVYIVGRLQGPGIVENLGVVHNLHFGHEKRISTELVQMENWMKVSGINAERKDNAYKEIWRKFLFISSSASLTSYHDASFHDLYENKDLRARMVLVMNEIVSVASAEGLRFEGDMVQEMLNHCLRLPANSTSSMNSDFRNNHKTELESLTGTVIRMAIEHGIQVPVYQEIYEALKSRENEFQTNLPEQIV